MSKKKVILSTIAILLVMFAAVSVVSYSIANLGHGDNSNIAQSKLNNYGAGETDAEYVTCIDLILENAEAGETFNIVEIVPNGVAAPTGLGNYSSSGGFAKYVLYAYRDTYEGTFTEAQFKSMVNYKLLRVNSSTLLTHAMSETDTTTVQNVLDAADLIYVSSPTYNSYTGDVNNMSEDILNYLRLYISADKPIVMDFVTSTTVTETSNPTYGTLADSIRNNHIKFRSYGWESNVTAEEFFKATKSYYLKYNVNTLENKAPGTVLVITASDAPGANSLYGKMDGYKDLIANAYYGLSSKKPTEMKYTIWNVNSNALTVEELNKGYDFVVIEGDVKSVVIQDTDATTSNNEVYDKLKALSESSKYILYAADLVSASNGTISVQTNNYLKLLQLYVSEKGVEQRSNVLAVSPGYFASLNEQKEAGVEGAKPVADLLNGSDYRGSSTSGAASEKYRVLEIQPCYPIDLELAKEQSKTSCYDSIAGGYYTKPDQVLTGVTKDEIEEGTEYYAFEMSRAKVAYATGIPYDQIEVVQMSTNELITSKDVIAENYDMVYIGGNASALVPSSLYRYSGVGKGNVDGNLVTTWTTSFTGFDMYTHTGYLADYQLAYNKVAGGTNSVTYNGNDLTVTKREELKAFVDAGLPIIIDKRVADAFKATYDYDANNKYSKVEPSRLVQLGKHDIDPDCNMYKFLAYVYDGHMADQTNAEDAVDTFTNVSWGKVDTANNTTKVENMLQVEVKDSAGNPVKDENGEIVYDIIDRAYGNTIGPEVTVYNEAASKEIHDLYKLSNERPKLVLTSHPKEYIETNATTKNIGNVVKFTVGASTSSTTDTFKVSLLVDEDGDGVFSPGEEKANGTCVGSTTTELSYNLDDTFFGLISWKIKLTTADGTLVDVATGLSFFKPDDETKKEIKVLQIMPVESIDDYLPNGVTPETATEANWATAQNAYSGKDYVGSGAYSLYFCTECQLSGKIIENNVTMNYNDITQEHKKSFHDITTVWSNFGKVKKGATLGKHEHDFGIVIYDTVAGEENWESNFADALTRGADGKTGSGEYEFDLDIMTVPQFEKLCNNATNGVADCSETTKLCYTLNANDEKEYADPYNLCDVCAEEYAEVLLSDYKGALKDITSETHILKNNLETAIFEMLAAIKPNYLYYDRLVEGVGTVDKPGDWIVNQEYYKFLQYFNDSIAGIGSTIAQNNVTDTTKIDNLVDAYNAYITAYNAVIEKKELYKAVSYQFGDGENWLLNNYDVVVFGLSNEFNNKDLNVESCSQIKSYVAQGGAVLNTHETLTAKPNTSVTMSDELRETFGMDRFHVLGVKDDSSTVTVSILEPASKVIALTQTNWIDWNQTTLVEYDGTTAGANAIRLNNKDVTVTIGNNKTITNVVETGEAKPYGEPLTVTVNVADQYGGYISCKDMSTGVVSNHNLSGFTVSFNVAQGSNKTTATFEMGTANVTGTMEKSTGALTTTEVAADADADASADASTYSIDITVTDNGTAVPDGTQVSFTYKGTEKVVSTANGVASTTISSASYANPLTQPTGVKYRQYVTKDSSKYFWTERLQSETPAGYANLIATKGITNDVKYNAPVGITDYFVAYDTDGANSISPFRYAYNRVSFVDQKGLETDGNNSEFKYGSRKAEIVNQGGVTMYPFSISDTMLISPTHPQTFALDIEDEDVAVWYTMAGTYTENAPKVQVTQGEAQLSSSFFAASPKDGMNNYFLYSKDNIFFTGAGHQTITGVKKDNNDERKLFINVIVNSAIRGKNPPALRLYNKCSDENCKDTACKCYVDPSKAKPAKVEKNTLYYNDQINMYQYDIEDDGSDTYPEFDFKVLAGSAQLKDIQVFYDLDYGVVVDETAGTKNFSDMYSNDDNHALITSYSPAADQDGVRIQLREDIQGNKLLLQDDYFTNYNNYTYIVIRAKDVRGETVSARIKINIIPYLFDLTDAGSQVQKNVVDAIVLDKSDRRYKI